MSRYDLAIVGGGLLGRLIAWRAAVKGLRSRSTMRMIVTAAEQQPGIVTAAEQQPG